MPVSGHGLFVWEETLSVQASIPAPRMVVAAIASAIGRARAKAKTPWRVSVWEDTRMGIFLLFAGMAEFSPSMTNI